MKSARVRVVAVALTGILVVAGLTLLAMRGGADGSSEQADELVVRSSGGDSGGPASGSSEETNAPSHDDEPFDMPDVEPPGMFDPPTPAEMRDLATVAEQRGISLEEAVATRGWRRGFSQLVQEISARHPESFAGAAIEPDGSVWIAFTGAVPSDVVSLVEEFERVVLEPRASSKQIQLRPNQEPE